MKKLMVLLCAVAMLFSLAACDENPSQGTTATPQNTVSSEPQSSQEASQEPSVNATTDPEQTQSGNPTTAPEQTQVGGETNEPEQTATSAPEQTEQVTTAPTQEIQVTPEPTQMAGITGSVMYADNTEFRISFVENGHGKGTLTVELVMHVPDDMITAMQQTPPFEMAEFRVFDVEVTNDNGKYIAKGGAIAAGMKLRGNNDTVDAFRDILLQNEDGDSELSKLTIRAINGETLTGEDIENYTWKFDEKFEIPFEIDGDKLVFNSFVSTYTEWGTMDELDITYSSQEGVIRKEQIVNGGELENIMYYRQDGTREKEEFYSDGVVSNTYYYDENGDLIEDMGTRYE